MVTALQRQQLRNRPGMLECIACGGSGQKSRNFSGDPTCRACQGTGAVRDQMLHHMTEDETIVHIPQHSSESAEHFTPEPIIQAAREVLGGIDLDPASCSLANEVVQATAFYGPGSEHGEDGLALPWLGKVFLNPPGGRVPKQWQGMGTNSNAALWWGRLASSWQAGEVEAAIFVGFTLEILRSAQALDVPQPLDFPMCVPSKRIAFDTEALGKRVESSQPTHANVIVWLYPRSGWVNADRDRFVEAFSPIGRCRA